MRYRDSLGNIAISQMSLKEVIDEATNRMNLLDRNKLHVKKESDIRVTFLLGQAYTPFQFIRFEETEETREYARAVLIHLETQEIAPLKFEAYYDNEKGEWHSFAHRFLDNLRELCLENNLYTEKEQQAFLDQQYQNYQ